MTARLKMETRLALRRASQRALLKRFIVHAERHGWVGDCGTIKQPWRGAALTYFRAIYDFERAQGNGPFVVQEVWIRSFEGGCVYIKAKALLALLDTPVRPRRVVIDEAAGMAS
jgi:hypothetical protein